MRYITRREEERTWLILSALWAVGGLLAWLVSVFAGPEVVSSATLFAAAILVALVGLALRLPIVTGSPHEEQLPDLTVALLCGAATVNWLGCLMFHAASFLQAVPAITVILLAEIWIHCQFYFEDSLVHFGGRSDFSENSVGPVGARHARTAASNVPEQTNEKRPLDVPAEQVRAERGGAISRSYVDAVDEQGRRYLSGEVHVEFEPGQTVEEVVIGFCPAFEGVPDVEFEVNSECISPRVLNCTPAGIRIALKRAGGEAVLEQALKFDLEWYAVQISHPGGAELQSTELVLP